MLFLFIGGASASGKTQVAKEVTKLLRQKNIEVVELSLDNYYKSQTERGGVVEINFDVPQAFNFDLFRNQLEKLEAKEVIERPTYCFLEKNRLSKTQTLDPNKAEVVVIEGILALHEVRRLNLSNIFTVFVETDSYMAIRKRREKRDEVERATTPEETKKRELTTVGPAFFAHILPTKGNADLIVANNESDAVGPFIESNTKEENPINNAVPEGVVKAAQEIIHEVEEKFPSIFSSDEVGQRLEIIGQ